VKKYTLTIPTEKESVWASFKESVFKQRHGNLDKAIIAALEKVMK